MHVSLKDVIGRLVKKGDISTTEKGIRRMEVEVVDERFIFFDLTNMQVQK